MELLRQAVHAGRLMSADPVLVLQLRRMGDLILTFPLLLALERLYAGHPLWVVAEPRFFNELMPLAPQAVFFPPEQLPALAQRNYVAAINLDSRRDAATCMGSVRAPFKLGPVFSENALRIQGFWQLYRASLTRNNRHNAFHWGDLQRLDVLSAGHSSPLGMPRPARKAEGRVGLVIGASEVAKMPDVKFWARLATRLVKSGLTPVFLGGPAEIEAGQEVSRLARLPQANLCGRLSLYQMAVLMQGLDLCVTPDTGPMHLADWVGVPVLNLSMGPVHARETGPVSPGQWVLRAAMSCVGCWSCERSHPVCKAAFTPDKVARVIMHVLEHPEKIEENSGCSGLQLLRTDRDELGLHMLSPVGNSPAVGKLLEDFWQAAFLSFSAPDFVSLLSLRAKTLLTKQPKLGEQLCKSLGRLLTVWTRQVGRQLQDDFWAFQPQLLRIFVGHAQMTLQNEDFSKTSWQCVLDRTELLLKTLAG